MKTFFTVFFAILAAAAIIIAGLWAKFRVDAWEFAWRGCEAQISSIRESEQTPVSASEYSSTFGSSSMEAAEERVRGAKMKFERSLADRDRIENLERRTITILEQKPFGLPLTASERKELDSLKEAVRKLHGK
jgi:hypothetical protein